MAEKNKAAKIEKTKVSRDEIARRQKYLKRQENHFNHLLEKEKEKRKPLYVKIKALENTNQQLKKENTSLKSTINREKKAKEKQKTIEEIARKDHIRNLYGKIIDCPARRKAVQNVGYSKSKDRNRITGRTLKITYTDELPCKFSSHISDDIKAKIVIETEREKDSFCISLCSECLDALIRALKETNETNSYYVDDNKGIEIKYTSGFSGQSCFSCYKSNQPCYHIRIGNVALKICADCRACWLMQLEKAQNTIKGTHNA